eukprot:Selendium_serpulae@DN10859_c0_g1_i1.p1
MVSSLIDAFYVFGVSKNTILKGWKDLKPPIASKITFPCEMIARLAPPSETLPFDDTLATFCFPEGQLPVSRRVELVSGSHNDSVSRQPSITGVSKRRSSLCAVVTLTNSKVSQQVRVLGSVSLENRVACHLRTWVIL